jgi:hypothetical protein
LVSVAGSGPEESTEYEGMIDFHWRFDSHGEAKRLANSLREIARKPEIVVFGHAEHWVKAEVAGSLEGRDCTITCRLGGQKLAMAVVHWDLEGLRAEVEFERVIMKSSSGSRTVKSAASPAQQAQTAIGGS